MQHTVRLIDVTRFESLTLKSETASKEGVVFGNTTLGLQLQTTATAIADDLCEKFVKQRRSIACGNKW
jgi:hypothetical protein